MKKNVLFFKNVSSESQIEIYDVLPDIRKNWLQKMVF